MNTNPMNTNPMKTVARVCIRGAKSTINALSTLPTAIIAREACCDSAPERPTHPRKSPVSSPNTMAFQSAADRWLRVVLIGGRSSVLLVSLAENERLMCRGFVAKFRTGSQ